MSTETLDMPPGEKAAINKMADAFKGAIGAIQKPAATPAAIAQAPAVPTKPAEKPEPEKKSPARQQFEELEKLKNRYKTEAETVAPKLSALEAELAAAKAKAEEADRLRAEHEELKQKFATADFALKQFAMEKHPSFQKHFADRTQAVIAEAKATVGDEHAAQLEQILSLPPSELRDQQLEALSAGLTEFKKMDLCDAYRTLKRTEKEKQDELAKAPDNLKRLQEQAASRAEAEQLKVIQQRATLLNHINTQIESDLKDADPTLATMIRTNIKRAVEGQSTEHYVHTLVSAAKWQRHESSLKEKDEMIAKLESQIAELQSSQPTLRGTGGQIPAKHEFEEPGIKYRRALAGQHRQPGYQPA